MINKEKAEKYDILDCIEMKEVCPNCEKEMTVKLTAFKSASFSVGLVWTCPHCHKDIYIEEIKLGARK
jgi:transposase-like protein